MPEAVVVTNPNEKQKGNRNRASLTNLTNLPNEDQQRPNEKAKGELKVRAAETQGPKKGEPKRRPTEPQ